jgi:hypothetical protein
MASTKQFHDLLNMTRRPILAALASALLLLAACSGQPGQPSSIMPAPSESSGVNAPTSTVTLTPRPDMTEGTPDMQIQLTAGETILRATLFDNETSRDFVSRLPLTLPLTDYAGTEKISDLPVQLSTSGAPAGADPEIGDITYYAPWGNLAIFYKDFGHSQGLIKLGHIDSGIDELAGISDGREVTIEVVVE